MLRKVEQLQRRSLEGLHAAILPRRPDEMSRVALFATHIVVDEDNLCAATWPRPLADLAQRRQSTGVAARDRR
jgi:hypothetical protein